MTISTLNSQTDVSDKFTTSMKRCNIFSSVCLTSWVLVYFDISEKLFLSLIRDHVGLPLPFSTFCNVLKLSYEPQISYLCSPWKMTYIKLLISSPARLTMLKYKKWTLILGKLWTTGSRTILKWEV
jgi:hypothetical protein